MNLSSKMPVELEKICTAWSKRVEAIPDKDGRIGFFKQHLPELLMNGGLFEDLVNRITRGAPFPGVGRADAFDNEILLYLNPRRIFSLRMFFFGVEDFTPIHDHNAWGVTGTALNELTIVRYHRDDDESVDGYAKIYETSRVTLLPGDIEITRPLNLGIHKSGSATQNPVVMVSVYGNPVRRLYVNGYDLGKNRVFKMYAPKVKKKMLARQIQDHMDEPP